MRRGIICLLLLAVLYVYVIEAKTGRAGNLVKNRRRIDSSRSQLFISAGRGFRFAGTVTRWRVYIRRAGSVSLQVWRRRGRSSLFTLVGQIQKRFYTTGAHNVATPGSKGIKVRKGDVIGLYFPSYGIVPFDGVSCSSASYIYYKSKPRFGVGKTVVTNLLKCCCACRYYSVQAFYTSNSGPGVLTVTPTRSFRSCRDIRKYRPLAPTGEYTIRTYRGRFIKVYCEFGIGSCAYTFFHPTAFVYLSHVDINYIQRDKRTVLLRAHYTNGLQPYGIASQLSSYRGYPVRALLSSHSGYQKPVNRDYLGKPYLFVGFLPDSVASRKTIQGLTINGAQIQFKNCDANGNSHLSVFPNFREKKAVNYAFSWNWGGGSVCTNIFRNLKNPYSCRQMTVDYFMFTETHWGGCGCYGHTVRYGSSVRHFLLGMAVGLH